ncbi:hypothetical protein LC55x_3176 [Lysobacter capsici]|uniref:hypothetical protein n=1 Tax=Lysobacter capsici TaxID=435897 RepID=UPI000722F4AF|nr:hypothetical protein [Lysobacter capsici]ALN86439.1 hypothetical protein LC55x_3176 [Lysobacter capsici]
MATLRDHRRSVSLMRLASGESRGRMCSQHARIRRGHRVRSMVRRWHTHRLSASTTAPEAKRLSPMTEDTGFVERVDECVDVRRT